MMESREYLNSLFDIYKELLTPTEKETFIDYYVEDLSLQEIADNRNISRSSAGKTLKSAVKKLLNYENILKMYLKNDKLKQILVENDINKIKNEIQSICNS